MKYLDLEDLFNHLEESLARQDCDNSHCHTREWAAGRGVSAGEQTQLLDYLESRGGCCCDCEVLLNVAYR